MAIAITRLLRDLTQEGVLDDFKEIAKALGLSTTAWQPGEPVLGLAAIFSRQIARLWNDYVVKALRAPFLDYAEGDWLTLAALAIYGVRRRGKTFATVDIVLENRAGGFWDASDGLGVGQVRIRNAAGKTFRNTTSGTLASWPGTGDYPTVTLTFEADEAGSASDTAIGGISTTPVTAPEGVFPRTNTAAAFGQDEETDERLKERCRLSTGGLSPAGPLAAYEFVALTTRRPTDDEPDRLLATEDGDVTANVTRVRVLHANVEGSGVLPGNVLVYLASDSGPATGDVDTEGTDVFLVNAALVRHVLPPGIELAVEPAEALAVTVAVTVYVDRASNVSASVAEAAAEAALEDYFRTFRIGGQRLSEGAGGRLFRSEVEAKASESSHGIFKSTATLTASSMDGADVVVAMNQVVVPTITVTATVVTQ